MARTKRVFISFQYEDKGLKNFWMKDTFIPLDIIFINANKEIVYIAYNAKPVARTPVYDSQGNLSEGYEIYRSPAKYVLEVNRGFAEKHDIRVGNTVSWKFAKS